MVRRVSSRLACLLVVLAAPACGGNDEPEPRPTPPGPRLTADVARELDARLRESVADAGIPGASAAVVFRDGRIWRGAAGDAVVKPKRAMTPDTSLPFDSVTKVAVAALAMRLVEQGRLRLEDPIVRWYPGLARQRRAPPSRDLLGHTAGIRDPAVDLAPGTKLPTQRRLARHSSEAGPPDRPRPCTRTSVT